MKKTEMQRVCMDIADVWRMSSVLKTAFLPKKLVKVQKK